MQTSIIIDNSLPPTFVAVSVEDFGLRSLEKQEVLRRKLENWMRNKLRKLYAEGLVSYYPLSLRNGQRLLIEYKLIWKQGAQENYESLGWVNRAYFEYHEYGNCSTGGAVIAKRKPNVATTNPARPFGTRL